MSTEKHADTGSYELTVTETPSASPTMMHTEEGRTRTRFRRLEAERDDNWQKETFYFELNKEKIASRYAEAVRVENEAVAAKDEAQVEFVKRITASDEPTGSSSSS